MYRYNKSKMLYEVCAEIPYELFTKCSTFVHNDLYDVKDSAIAGSPLCTIVKHNLELQEWRGTARQRVKLRPLVLANQSKRFFVNHPELLYVDETFS